MKFRQAYDAADIRLVLISDLHAYDNTSETEVKPSFLKIGDEDSSSGGNPLTDLKRLIREETIKGDALLCMGDITDKARPIGMRYAWQKLDEIKTALGAELLVATSGNHDCDSRYKYTDHDAKGVLQSLSPTYPFPDEGVADHYWARNFLLIERENYRVVSLNSSAYHGMAPEEIDHGRVSVATLARLKETLSSTPERTVNILICHHHPHSHSELGLGEDDLMKSGQQLLELLGSGEYGRWIVAHGHKHHPKLTYAQGVGTAPVVLACGSLSACLYPELGTNARNQFHIICVNLDEARQHGLVGRIHTWEWTAGHGWADAQKGSGLPAVTGFGFRCDPIQLAKQVAVFVGRKKRLLWESIRQSIPEVDFILPAEYAVLRRQLRATAGLEIIERDDIPFEIGRFE
jgi:hypothetical protein